MNIDINNVGDKSFKKRFPRESFEKQHKKGKLHAIERINYFFNKSFEEIMEEVSGVPEQYEGVLTGWGSVNGRKIFFYSQDFTVKGGSVGKYHALKIIKIMDLAIKTGNMFVSFIDSGGAKIEEGVDSLEGYSNIFKRIVKASGWIPQISLVMGPSAGGAVYSPALSDFICMVKGTSFMFVNGPKIVKELTGESITKDELGGAHVHTEVSGVAHFLGDNEYECMDIVKKLISYLPSNSNEYPPSIKYKGYKDEIAELDYYLEKIKANEEFNISDVIRSFLDEDSFMEIQSFFAKNIVIGFGRLYGDVVGIVANNRSFQEGRLDSDAGDKASRFVSFCDAFNIPIITVVDTPGFVLGSDEERKGIIRHVAKLLYRYAESTVPMITIIIGRAYGGGYISMGSKSLGSDIVYSWPSASIGVMNAEEAFKILYGDKDGDKISLDKFKNDYIDKIESPYNAASRGYVNKIIVPKKTRVMLRKALEVLNRKDIKYNKGKKHGIPPV